MLQNLSCYCQQGWCDIPGTVEQVKTKLKMRKEAAIKRDRTMSYSNSTQVMKLTRCNIFMSFSYDKTIKLIINIYEL